MDAALLKLVVPQIPSLSYAAASHLLRFSDTSSKWDLRTAVTVQVLRNIMTVPRKSGAARSISRVQKRSIVDAGIKGKIWVAKAVVKRPEDGEGGEATDGSVLGVKDTVCKAVDDLATEPVTYTRPETADVQVEWTGYRPGATRDEKLPSVTEAEKFKRMLAEPTRTSETTVLYFHGGAYYLADPSTHRDFTCRLAKECKGVVCSVRYRLAPQTAFPGQLIDALMLYLSLLYPPADSLHEPIPAEHIVLGGDSAGGNLAFALLQLLLHLHRSSDGVPLVRFHGRDVHVPLPAGCSANSGWFDLSRALPSIESNSQWDYLPAARHDDTVSIFPRDDVWPTTPPRGDLFCDLSLLDHPLASVVLADWTGACPLWMCTGQEMLFDEDVVVASRAARAGVRVHFEQYEAMPHCFALLMPHLATADRLMYSWGDWARRCVEEPAAMESSGTWIPAKQGAEQAVDVASMLTVNFDEVARLVGAAKLKRLQGFQTEGKMPLPKPAL